MNQRKQSSSVENVMREYIKKKIAKRREMIG